MSKAPRMAVKLKLLVDQFKSDPWWRKHFKAGNYSDPAACFDNFVIRQEGNAIDRGIPLPPEPSAKLRRPPLVAGSPEWKATYD